MEFRTSNGLAHPIPSTGIHEDGTAEGANQVI